MAKATGASVPYRQCTVYHMARSRYLAGSGLIAIIKARNIDYVIHLGQNVPPYTNRLSAG